MQSIHSRKNKQKELLKLLFTFILALNSISFNAQPGSYTNHVNFTVYNPSINCELDSIYTIIDTNAINHPTFNREYSKCNNNLNLIVSCFISPEFLILKYNENNIDTMKVIIDCVKASNGQKLKFTPMDWNFEINLPFKPGAFILSAEIFKPHVFENKFKRIKTIHSLDKNELIKIFNRETEFSEKHYLKQLLKGNDENHLYSYHWSSKEILVNTKSEEHLYLMKDSSFVYELISPNLDHSTSEYTVGRFSIKGKYLTLYPDFIYNVFNRDFSTFYVHKFQYRIRGNKVIPLTNQYNSFNSTLLKYVR